MLRKRKRGEPRKRKHQGNKKKEKEEPNARGDPPTYGADPHILICDCLFWLISCGSEVCSPICIVGVSSLHLPQTLPCNRTARLRQSCCITNCGRRSQSAARAFLRTPDAAGRSFALTVSHLLILFSFLYSSHSCTLSVFSPSLLLSRRLLFSAIQTIKTRFYLEIRRIKSFTKAWPAAPTVAPNKPTAPTANFKKVSLACFFHPLSLILSGSSFSLQLVCISLQCRFCTSIALWPM